MSPEFEKFLMEKEEKLENTFSKVIKFLKWFIILSFVVAFLLGVLSCFFSI